MKVSRLYQWGIRAVIVTVMWTNGALAAKPRRSIINIPSSNGYCTVSYNLNKKTVDQFKPHITDVWDVGQITPNLIEGFGCRLEIGNKHIELGKIPIAHSNYISGTGIVRVEHKAKDLTVINYIWAPMVLDYKAMFSLYRIPKDNVWNFKPSQIKPYVQSSDSNLVDIRLEQSTEDAVWVGLILFYKEGISEETCAKVQKELATARPKLLLEAEQRWWMHWHRSGTAIPSHIIGKKYDILLQSAAFLKMAQCREPGPSYGQIINTLSPLQTKFAPSRDMTYAIIALSKVGHFEEARNALIFMLHADAGYFRNRRPTWGLGKTYLISLSYYTGMGYERAEYVGKSPLLYLDSQGLFLWAVTEYAKESSDVGFADRNWNTIKERVIDPLIDSIDENGLVREDSGFWNVPSPGEHFSYTSMSAFRGLNSAAMLSHLLKKDVYPELFTKTAAQLRGNILSKMTTGKTLLLTRSMETKRYPHFIDGSMVEAINWHVVNPFWRTARSIVQALEVFLKAGQGPRGYAQKFKNENSIENENLFISLRAVNALRMVGEKRRATELLDWIIDEAAANLEMIPEYLSTDQAIYYGSYPLIGLGAGAYILAVMPD